MVGRVHDRLVRFMVMCHTGETMERRHARLIEALQIGDVAIARQAMLDELHDARTDILERVIQEEGAFWRVGTSFE